MWETIVKATPYATPWLALIVSVVTGFFGIRGFLLSRRIQNEMKSDDILVAGVLHNPKLSHPDQENCVIQTTIFNKSRRKAYISKVEAFDQKNEEIDITWSNRIDHLGNPGDESRLIGIVDSTSLCVRRNDGEAFRHVRIEVSHSFSAHPMVLSYELGPGWQAYFAK